MNETLQASVLAIEGELTIYTAAEHVARVQGCLAASPALDLDLGALSEIDSAGLQLLLWASREASERGGRLRVLRRSEAVAEAIRLLQLDALLAPADPAEMTEELA